MAVEVRIPTILRTYTGGEKAVSGQGTTLAELIDGTHRPVYQLGTSDVNPCTCARWVELCGLYKRKTADDHAASRR